MTLPLELRLQRGLPPSLRLEREIPGGGMARVFLAEDLDLGRKVVLKVLAPDLAEGLSQERFKREIHLAAQLQHPHLVPVLQAGQIDGLPYFVMPYVVGEALRGRLTDGRALPVREAVSLLRDVARAMAYAHGEGVVHRDIKPDNVLISGGAAMVSDFGIAKALSSSRSLGDVNDSLTRAGSSLGTPTYMAPEQAAADPAADHRVDIYAFGIMAYELLTGRPPFHGRAPQSLLTAHLVETPADLAATAPALPATLTALVMQCLQKDPERRPQTALELIDRLEQINWSGERPAVRVRRRGLPMALVAGFAVVALGGWWWSRPGTGTAVNPKLVTVVPFRIATADPTLSYLREGMLDLLAAKLPGEGGLQATEPRQLLESWHAAGGTERSDLSSRDAHALAKQLGAGWLLLGDVVGTPARITLNASLFETNATEPRARVTLEGPPDSLGSLVDGLVERLLTTVSGASETNTTLTGTSLPALRSYLDGVARLRAGLPSSVQAFSDALDRDSTFAPSALGLVQATGWWNDGGRSARALRLAWQGRAQLSARDQALLLTIAGPRYPEDPSSRELMEASQHYLQLAPDRADAWYHQGDVLYHFGNALGVPDRAERSAEYFRKALAIDSTYVPGYIHLQQLAVELGDTALDRRLMRLRLAVDTTAYWITSHSWYRAAMAGDSVTARAMWARPGGRDNLLYSIVRTPLDAAGIDPEEAMRAADSLIARSTTPDGIRNTHRIAASLAMVFGRPELARTHLAAGYEPHDEGFDVRVVYDAILDAGDSAAAQAAYQRMLPQATGPIPGDSGAMLHQRAAIRAVLYWRLSHHDTTGFGRLMARVNPPGRSEVGKVPSLDAISEATLRAVHADVTGDATLPQRIDRLDSLLARANFRQGTGTRLQLSSILAGALFEKHGQPARALEAVRRRASWWTNEMPYTAVQLREEGRLAVGLGRNGDAIRAWRHYLSLRQSAEPRLQREVALVRRELGKLEVGKD